MEKRLDLRNMQLQCVSAQCAQYVSIEATKLVEVKIELLTKLPTMDFFNLQK